VVEKKESKFLAKSSQEIERKNMEEGKNANTHRLSKSLTEEDDHNENGLNESFASMQ